MANFSYYYQSLDSATLTYSATEDSGFDVDNIKDRNINTFFKDTNIGVTSINVVIDFGASDARACDSIILGNYIATSTDDVVWLAVQSADDAGMSVNATTHVNTQEIQSSSLTDYIKTFTAPAAVRRYWKITIADDASDNLDDVQIGTVFLGAAFDHDHDPDILPASEGRGYAVANAEALGGTRFSNIFNTTVRRNWSFEYHGIGTTFKANFESWADGVFVNANGFSRYPFYFTDDSGSTLYYVRAVGNLQFGLDAYQAYNTNIRLEEEL